MSGDRYYRWRLHHACNHYLRCECGAETYVVDLSQTVGDEEIILHARCDRGHGWQIKVKMQPLLAVWPWREESGREADAA